MGILVYYSNPDPMSEEFKSHELLEALKFAEKMRKIGYRHVCISTELEDSIGSAGVSAVEDGKTPDGHDYDWCKKHRGNPQV